MDHSPQEIPSDRAVWHTSALLLSSNAEQWGWDEKLGPLVNPKGGKLRKWSARDRYRNAFRQEFPKLLAGSNVFGLALSVKGGTVIDAFPELVDQMGLGDHLLVSGSIVTIAGTTLGHSLAMPLSQAAYIIYLLHFICRMHALVIKAMSEECPDDPLPCDWQISPDNFPRGVDGPMATLFSLTANSAAALRLVNGNLRVLTHHVGGDPGVDVCDNLAGMLSHDIQGRTPADLDFYDRPKMGGMYWEVHGAEALAT